MTEQQIKQNAEEYANKPYYDNVYDIKVNAYFAGAHSRDGEIEQLESLLDKAVHLLTETNSGSDFFCERLGEIPEEDLHCMTYCDKDDIRCDCVLRYLKTLQERR